MANLKTRLVVKALEGADLRREPHRNSKTEEGNDNLILSLPLGTYVVLESADIHATDEHRWALVKPEIRNEAETGWVDVDELMDIREFVVTAMRGVDLLREPTWESKTEDGRDNIILTLPLGTRFTFLRNILYSADGSPWGLVKPKIGNEQEIGWVYLYYWTRERKFVVKVREGTDLRREPSIKSETEDGKNNVIFSLGLSTRLVKLSDDIKIADGHHWVFVQPGIENEQVAGWVIADDLRPEIEPEAPPTTAYDFRFRGKKYRIREDKLDGVIGRYIFKTRLPDSRRITINSCKYFTTQDKIDAMKDPRLKVIEEI